MQIVIDISEEEYDAIKAGHSVWLTAQRGGGKTITIDLIKAIHNGTPLPKGHGRLIDADALEYTCNSDECGMLNGCNDCQYHIITEWELDRAQTIIEADKEVDE